MLVLVRVVQVLMKLRHSIVVSIGRLLLKNVTMLGHRGANIVVGGWMVMVMRMLVMVVVCGEQVICLLLVWIAAMDGELVRMWMLVVSIGERVLGVHRVACCGCLGLVVGRE